jgi:glucosamine--fructose-6-phosphate aminotransferase (isomerizing)
MTMVAEDSRMFAEAGESGDAVERQLAANEDAVAALAATLIAERPRGVVTFARGSSDHAATFGKYLIETRLGLLTTSGAPSVASVYGSAPDYSGMLALGISQSGRSPDILAGMRAAKEAGARTVALVNVTDSPLAREADICLPLHAGPERSVAATKSYIAALAGLVHLVARWSEDRILLEALREAPPRLRQAWQSDWTPLVDRLVAARGLYVIGRGLGLGVAQEAALKFKETCSLHAEAFSAAEVRHGPMTLVGPDFPLLVFRQGDATADGVDELVADVVARNGSVLVSGGDVAGAILLPHIATHPVIEPMLQIQSFYRAANALSLRRGLDPDRPPQLRKVTETI